MIPDETARGRHHRRVAVGPAVSLSPSERVVPSWTDPTVRRASTMIGGPLGSHASVGRARIFTPLRVALVMGIIALIVGWLAKSACIQTGANGELDQGGQKPWITGCYNDIVPLYASRGLDDPSRNPYAFAWVDHGTGQGAGRVFPRDAVHREGDGWAANDAGTPVAVGPNDLVGDEHSGYSQVVDGQLVAAPAGAAAEVRYLEYPVLTGYLMWGAAALTSWYTNAAESTGVLPVPLEVGAYFTITAILLGLVYLWSIASTARIVRRRIWDVAIMCAAPLLMVQAFTNWDLLAVGFTAGSMAAWSRKRSLLCGALLGLGTAAKLYPMLLLGPLLVLCLRAGKVRQFNRTLAAAVVAWLVVNLPVLIPHPRAWAEFFTMNQARGPEWDSWYFLSTVIAPTARWWSDLAGNATVLTNALSLALFVVACAAIAWLGLSARRRPRFAQLAFLVVVAFLLTNKVFSPQYSLWVLPLAVLAVPRWRRVLLWQLAEVAVWYLLMLSFDTDAGKNLPIEPFAIAAVLRDALLIALAVRVIREILRPDWDLVRAAGDDDPSGGVLEDAPDRFTVPSLPTLARGGRDASPALVR